MSKRGNRSDGGSPRGRSRPDRTSRQSSYIFGRHPVGELLRQSPQEIEKLYVASSESSTRLSEVMDQAKRADLNIVVVAKKVIMELVGDVNHQGLVAKVKPFTYVEIDAVLGRAAQRQEKPLVVVLDQIQDPQNLGAIIRSAHALGAHGLIIPKDRACEVTPAAVRASAGATAHLPVAMVTNLRQALDALRKEGLWIIGTHLDGETPLYKVDFREPTALVIGSEGRGLRRLTAESCDTLTSIPMVAAQGIAVGSLNASVAAGLCLYEALRQRRQ